LILHGTDSRTGQDASASVAVGDGAAGINAELRRRQSSKDADLSVTNLANCAGDPARSCQAEATCVASAYKSLRASREGCDSDNVFHNWETQQRETVQRKTLVQGKKASVRA